MSLEDKKHNLFCEFAGTSTMTAVGGVPAAGGGGTSTMTAVGGVPGRSTMTAVGGALGEFSESNNTISIIIMFAGGALPSIDVGGPPTPALGGGGGGGGGPGGTTSAYFGVGGGGGGGGESCNVNNL